jgi:hypothetical protein
VGGERTAKRAKIEEEDDMEIEMEDDEDGELRQWASGGKGGRSGQGAGGESRMRHEGEGSGRVNAWDGGRYGGRGQEGRWEGEKCQPNPHALTPVTGEGIAVVCTNLPAECNEDIMGALFSQYPGFTRAVAFSGPVPASHPPPNADAKSFRALFGSRSEAEAAVAPLNGYLMQPGWEMAVSVQA